MPNKITIAKTEPHIAQAALNGFQPFTMDPEKHARYNAYLQSQAFPDNGPSTLEPLPGQNVDEFNTEMESYAKAALLFKPMSGAMASRFTAAAVVEGGPKIHEGLHTPSVSDQTKGDGPSAKEAEKKAEEDPKVHAARVGMYGPLTREVKPWQPAKLLCKRFGVKDPNPEPEPEPEPASATAASSWQAPETSTATGSGAPSSSSSSSGMPNVVPEGSASRKGGRRDLANVGLGEDEDQGRDTLSYVRPAMDIFKAIFASDDEHSDGDDNDEGPGDDEKPAIDPSVPSTSGSNVARSSAAVPSTSPAQTLQEKIDPGTFKPTFIPRSERDGRSKEKKEKKSKKNKHGKAVLVSFELEEGGGGVASAPGDKVKERPKKKKREGRREEKDKDDAMWIEKSKPEIGLKPPDISMAGNAMEGTEHEPSRGRKRAIDFM
jgi:G patch domain-containing protein 1